jgi:hypothetical protein
MRVWYPLLIALSLVGFAIAPVGSSAAVLRGSIEYSKSGGIAGIEEAMKIDREGRGKIARRTFRLSSRERRSLAAALRRADLASVRSPKGGGCCDFFAYEIRYRGHTVSWDESSDRLVGRRVRELQAMLGELYARYAG